MTEKTRSIVRAFNTKAAEAREAGMFVANGKVFDHRPTEAERPLKPICDVMEWGR